jgi:glycosyltransferase involved in cell wall biosynthesis
VRILVLTDRYWPEIAAPSFRLHEHARVWVRDGHDVTVVTCAPNFPRGVLFDGYRNRWRQEEWRDGVRIVRVASYLAPNEGVVRRLVDYVSFMVSAVLQAHAYPEFDVILASSPPFFTAIAGWGVSILRGRPWVFEIRDLWPASVRAVGASRSPLLALVEAFELFLYRRADRILALTHSFVDDLASRGIPRAKIDVVTNGVDASQFSPELATVDARAEMGLARDEFLAGYIGTVGMAHGLETVLDAAELCRGHRVRFLILGEGAHRRRLEDDARRRGLENVVFRDFVPHDAMPGYLGALDASIVHLRPDPLFRTVIPSKIFESMAMGVPIVMAVEGESAGIVEEAAAGVCIPSGDPQAMARAVLALAADRERGRAMGRAGVVAVRERYGREPLARRAAQTLAAAATGRER